MIEGPFQHLRRHFDQRACEERAERSCIATWHTCLEPGQADLIQGAFWGGSGVWHGGSRIWVPVLWLGFRDVLLLVLKTLLFLSLICCSWHQLAAQILIRWDPALRMKRYSWEWPWAAQWLGEKCWNEDHSFIVCCVLRRNPDPQKQHVPRCSREEGRARCSAREGRSPDFSPPLYPIQNALQNAASKRPKTQNARGARSFTRLVEPTLQGLRDLLQERHLRPRPRPQTPKRSQQIPTGFRA